MHSAVAATTAAVALLLTACVTSPVTDGGADVADAAFTDDPMSVAQRYIGLNENEALAQAQGEGRQARVGTAEDVGRPGQTDDYEVGRLTFVVRDGVVAEVVVETATGPETVAAS